MKRVTALLLSFLLLCSLALTGCGDKGLEGSWKGQVNLTGVMKEIWDKSIQRFPELQDEMEIDEVPVYLTMEFREDGTCVVDVDEDSLEKFFTQTRDQMKAVVGAHMDKAIDKSSEAMGDLGELSGLFDFSMQSLQNLVSIGIDNIFGPMMQHAILTGIEGTGRYMEKDALLYISSDVDTPAEGGMAHPYKLERDTLTIESWVVSAGGKYGNLTFPLILERQ